MAVRVLLITPEFYGIEKIIKSALEESDYEVVWIENKTLPFDYHGTQAKLKFLRKIYFFFFSPIKKYLRKELKKIENPKFDIIFSINAHIICPFLFKRLGSYNPELFSILYLWDSFSMFDWSKELKLFNQVYTFDPADSINFQLNYKPNFYVKSSIITNNETEYDLFFTGKYSPDRFALIDKMYTLPEMSGIKWYVRLWAAYKIFFHNHLIYSIFKKVNLKNDWITNYLLNFEAIEGITKREYLVIESMEFKEMQHHFFSSNVILDLPYQNQTGYTHRLIEALAIGRKVITTNANIRKEKFYNAEQIKILDKQNPEIDLNWVKKKSIFPVDDYFLNLELSNWIKSIINVEIV